MSSTPTKAIKIPGSECEERKSPKAPRTPSQEARDATAEILSSYTSGAPSRRLILAGERKKNAPPRARRPRPPNSGRSPSKRAAPSSDAGKSPKSPKVASEAPKAVRSPKPFSL